MMLLYLIKKGHLWFFGCFFFFFFWVVAAPDEFTTKSVAMNSVGTDW